MQHNRTVLFKGDVIDLFVLIIVQWYIVILPIVIIIVLL
jgi:hypothetical protein